MKKLISSIITIVSSLASFLLTMAVNFTYENNNFSNVKDENCACYTENMPERIFTIGDNGMKGYIYVDELLANSPSYSQEVVKILESMNNGKYETYEPVILNVYDADGKTVIDTKKLS